MNYGQSRAAYEAWCKSKGLNPDGEAASNGGKEISRDEYKALSMVEQANYLEAGGKVKDVDGNTSGIQTKEPKTPEEQAAALRTQVDQLTQQVNRLTAIAEKQLEIQTPRLTREKMTVAEKAAYIREHGQSAYLDIPFK